MSASVFTASVLIDRPIMDVFDFVRDPQRLPEWVPLYSDVQLERDFFQGSAEGKSFSATIGMKPWGWSQKVQCLDIVGGRSITFKTEGLFPQTATYTFEATSKGTILTALHSSWGWHALSPWSGPARPIVEDTIRQALTLLKVRLESLRHRPSEPRVFFSYRRDGDPYTGGRIVELLEREFGHGAVFRDVDSISGGNFVEQMRSALDNCEVVVAFIGPGWLAGYKQRHDQNQRDYVLEELAFALGLRLPDEYWNARDPGGSASRDPGALQARPLVLPVLEKDSLPGKTLYDQIENLPSELRDTLRHHQFYALRPDPDFKADAERVVSAVWRQLTLRARRPRERAG